MKPGEVVAEKFREIQRQLIMSSNGALKQPTTKWKAALWSKDSIEPAMLRFFHSYSFYLQYGTLYWWRDVQANFYVHKWTFSFIIRSFDLVWGENYHYLRQQQFLIDMMVHIENFDYLPGYCFYKVHWLVEIFFMFYHWLISSYLLLMFIFFL